MSFAKQSGGTGGWYRTPIPVFLLDSSSTIGAGLGSLAYDTAGLTVKYRRQGANTWTTVALASATVGTYANSGAAGTGGGFVADGGVTGSYEFSPPDAMVAAGAKWVVVQISGANLVPRTMMLELDVADYQLAPATASALSTLAGIVGGAYDVTIGADIGTLMTRLGTPATGTVAGDVEALIITVGSPVGASISADIAGVQSGVDDIYAIDVGLLSTVSGIDTKIGNPALGSLTAELATKATVASVSAVNAKIGTASGPLTLFESIEGVTMTGVRLGNFSHIGTFSSALLATFASVNTGETTAAPGSVARLAQGAGAK